MKNHFGYNKINIPFFRHIFYFHITFIKSFQYCQYYGNYNIQCRNKRQRKPLSSDFRNPSPTSLRTPPPSSHQLYYMLIRDTNPLSLFQSPSFCEIYKNGSTVLFMTDVLRSDCKLGS